MKHALLSIAVAEEIYQWKYVNGSYVTPEGTKTELRSYLSHPRAMKLLKHILETEKSKAGSRFARAQFDTPIRDTAHWCVKFLHKDGALYLKAMGKTMEEAIVRACLLSRGVIVDDQK